jgi:hypothetical protein
MKRSAKKNPLNFRNVHGVVIMNKYVAEKTFGPVKNRFRNPIRVQNRNDSARSRGVT